MKKAENFTVLELWNERGFPDTHLLLTYAGRNIAASYKARCNTIPETVEVYEEKMSRTFTVNQYPESFKKRANGILNRIQAKHKNKHPREEPKEKIKVKRPRIKKVP